MIPELKTLTHYVQESSNKSVFVFMFSPSYPLSLSPFPPFPSLTRPEAPTSSQPWPQLADCSENRYESSPDAPQR